MKTISEDKVDTYLKLGRTLAQFIKTDTYFEDNTFDWIKLEKDNDLYVATLVRSIDEGDETFTDVVEFETANEIDEFEHRFHKGTKEEVFEWMSSEFQVDFNQFHQLDQLSEKYLELVEAGQLGS